MSQNEIVSHHEMCGREGMSLQRGMNFRQPPMHSVMLSSHRVGAPYDDRLDENGSVLIYEGHDEPCSVSCRDPKNVDQPRTTKTGRLTQNGLFHEAAQAFVSGEAQPICIRVYEKIKTGIWAYNGLFYLEDSWTEKVQNRRIFKFKLRLKVEDRSFEAPLTERHKEERNRVIPSSVKVEVWQRDRGACVRCGSVHNLHFDHILPFSKGGSSETAANIQLLCMKHNLEKRDRIE